MDALAGASPILYLDIPLRSLNGWSCLKVIADITLQEWYKMVRSQVKPLSMQLLLVLEAALLRQRTIFRPSQDIFRCHLRHFEYRMMPSHFASFTCIGPKLFTLV